MANMKTRGNPGHGAMIACMFAIILLSGCRSTGNIGNFSADTAALQRIVAFDFTPQSAKWEVFGTPEYTGGVPAPTDYLTLVVELSPIARTAFDAMPRAKTVWIAPEAPRVWLSGPFLSMLEKEKNTTVDFSVRPDCRALKAIRGQSGKVVNGLLCTHADKMLVYIMISSGM
jgi:hypothetical protein